jgi:hypothetical protein
LLFRRGGKSGKALEVDLGDLQNEKENLSSFLHSHLKVEVTPNHDQLAVHSDKLSPQELQHVVTKFVYHRDFNSTHWVSIEGTTIKINRFKEAHKNKEKHAEKDQPHQTLAQSWGL